MKEYKVTFTDCEYVLLLAADIDDAQDRAIDWYGMMYDRPVPSISSIRKVR